MRVARIAIAAALSAALLPGVAFADPQGKGQGKGGGPSGGPPGQAPSPAAGTPAAAPGGAVVVIAPRDRIVIQQYYGQQFAAGNCPPGLAKKNNGCMPPGQAKQWARGQPLPGGVVTYGLPPHILAQITVPVGYQFVRVANDVLLMAVGTRLIVDAIADLGRL